MKKINFYQAALLVIYVVATIVLSWCAPVFTQSFFAEEGAALLLVCPTIIFVSWTVVVILLFNRLGDK